MATVKVEKPQIVTIAFNQEKSDDDYGSCLWARFLFDTENYDLHIISDCREYAHGWIPTPEKESFLKLMSGIKGDYLLEKISDMTVVDGDKTWKNVKEYITDVLDGEEPDFDFEDVENVCYYSDDREVYDALLDSLKYTNANNENADDYALFECIEKDYPANAKKIVQVFTEFIQPKIKEILKGDVENV